MLNHIDSFKLLAEKYGVPDSDLFLKVMEAMITPEEC